MNCPFARTDMTPCVLRDGALAVGLGDDGAPLCVGCNRWLTLPIDAAQRAALVAETAPRR